MAHYSVDDEHNKPEGWKVVQLLKSNQLWRLAAFRGCCCTSFRLRRINFFVVCDEHGKQPAVHVYHDGSIPTPESVKTLMPVMEEVIRQLRQAENFKFKCSYEDPKQVKRITI